MTRDRRQIKIIIEPGVELLTEPGITLLKLSEEYSSLHSSPIIAAKVYNDIKELRYVLEEDCRVKFIDLKDEDGMRIYSRSLYFILMKAAYDLFPERRVIISHAVDKGLFCELRGAKELDIMEVEQLEARMREIVSMEIPFNKREIPLQEAEDLFEASGRMDRYHAIEHRNKQIVTIYNCGGMDDYFYGCMAPDTGYNKVFALKHHRGVLIIQFPERTAPDKLPR